MDAPWTAPLHSGSACSDVSLSVIVPAYNEEAHLFGVVQRIHYTLSHSGIERFEIVLMNDGSSDGTERVAHEIAASLDRVRVVSFPVNQGKGFVLKVGFLLARGKRVAFIDADGEIDPQDLLRLDERMRQTGAGIVVGKKAVVGARSLPRRIMTRTLMGLNRKLLRLPVNDSQTGIKLFDRTSLQLLLRDCRETGFMFDLELLANAARRGLRIEEVPVDIRIVRASRIGVGAAFAGLRAALMLSLRFGVLGIRP